MGKFIFTYKKLVYFNLHVDLSAGGYGTFLLEQTDPKATGYDRVWEYVNDDITVLCKRIGNTVDSWAIAYYVGTMLEYFVEFRCEDPWNIIEGSFIYMIGQKFDPVITKVSPIPVAKYYNVFVDFKDLPDDKSRYADSFTLTLVDTSKTGIDREWKYVKRVEKGDPDWNNNFGTSTWYEYDISLWKYWKDESIWYLDYTFRLDRNGTGIDISVWRGTIDCENPWEATPDQISGTDGYIPKLSGIPVPE